MFKDKEKEYKEITAEELTKVIELINSEIYDNIMEREETLFNECWENNVSNKVKEKINLEFEDNLEKVVEKYKVELLAEYCNKRLINSIYSFKEFEFELDEYGYEMWDNFKDCLDDNPLSEIRAKQDNLNYKYRKGINER